MVPGRDGSSARMCGFTHTVRTNGGLDDEENDEKQELRPNTEDNVYCVIRCIDEGRLGDLDFADDITLLEDTQEGMREFTQWRF